MSFFDDASLAFLPSGAAGKDTKAYSIKPTDGSGDFTFSRGSNLAATRVGPTGLIEKGRENLLLRSNQFNTTWNYSNNTLVSGQSGYDGSNNAWLVTKVPASYVPITQSVSVSGVNTFSFYAKAGTAAFVRTYIPSGGWIINFDFASGNATNQATTNGLVSYSMTSVGNGWYRCSSTHSGSITDVRIYNEWAQTNATTYYVQDAQLEIGLAATEVITTGATTGKAGLLEDEPRFDYSGGATCPSLLLEGSRTNLLPQSEYFGDSSWNKSNITIDSSFYESPSGLNNAYNILETATNTDHRINSGYIGTIVNGDYVTYSVFAKYNGRQWLLMLNTFGSLTLRAYFDIQNKTIGTLDAGVTADIEDYGNGWYRCSMTAQADAAGGRSRIHLSDVDGGFSYLGDITKGVYIYGAQAEVGNYPTSYIPNHSGGSVTRGADASSVTGASSLIGQTEGTILCEFTIDELGSDVDILGINNSTNSEYIAIFKYTSNVLRSRVRANSISNTIDHSITATGTYKVALKYTASTFALFINGVKINEISATISFASTIERIFVGPALYVGLGKARYKQLLTLTEALSDADCITLTT